MTDHDRAIDLAPENAWFFSSRADTYRAMARYDDALTDLDRATELDPDALSVLLTLGSVHRALGRYDDAVADYTRAIGLIPGHAFPLTVRGIALSASGRHDEALADHERALTLDPDSAWMTAKRGDTYRAMGRYDDALADYNRAVELAPDHGWYRLDCAVALRLLNRPEQHDYLRRARELYSADASLDGPQAANARGNLMVVHCVAQQWDEAAEELARFLAGHPGPRRIHEAVDDLADLQRSFPTDRPRLQPLCHRLETTADDELGRHGMA